LRRLTLIVVLLVAWAGFGYGVNRLLDSRKSSLTQQTAALTPPEQTIALNVPGTIWVSQAGHLYRLHSGQFTDMHMPTARGSWIQPSLVPGGKLLVVARADAFSDIYMIDATTGAVLQQLTSNATKNGHVELNQWSYWPHLSIDGTSVIFNYDGPKTGSFEVDFAVWSGPLAGKLESTRWTTPNGYTGGDVAPAPLPGGGVVYASYGLNSAEQIVSRIATVSRPGAAPVYLTSDADDCNAPAVSPDGSELAVICTSDTQSARLEVIPLVKGVPGTPRVLVDGCLCASPAWSPDGSALLYLAPADTTGHFQLWWMTNVKAAAPTAPQLVTNKLDLDATSAPAWAPA
jgi:Tol biopolymer transport system component